MSSSEPRWHLLRRGARLAALLVVTMTAACTVQPLYLNAPSSPSTGLSYREDLASIAVKPVTTREAQEVRNHLIFLLGGGKGEPEQPRFTLTLGISRLSESAALIQVGDQNEPTAATITMYSNYALDTMDGTRIATGQREITSSYDVPRQEFAAVRAKIDAEDRAARELAELVRLAIVQDLARLPAK